MNSNDSKVIIFNNEPTLNLAKMKIKLNLNLTNVYYLSLLPSPYK